MSVDNDTIMTEVKGLVAKQREIVEKSGINSPEYKSFVEKTDGAFKKFDDINEANVKAYEESKEKNEELTERIKHLELIGVSGGAKSVTAEQRKSDNMEVTSAMLKGKSSWNNFLNTEGGETKAAFMMDAMSKENYAGLEGAEDMVSALKSYGIKASPDIMRSDMGELGGFLCPPEFSSEMNKNIIERAPLRSMVRVKSIGSKSINEPLRTGIPIAEWEGELEAGGDSGNVYASQEWNPARLTRSFAVSRDVLQSSQYDLIGDLISDMSIAFAVAEGQAFFNGNGVKKYQGWSTDDAVPEFETATNVLAFDDLIKLSGELKDGYDPMYTFNRKTLTYIRTLKDSQGRYIWNPMGEGAVGAPLLINGFRYSSAFIENDAPSVADGFPILFADMKLFYQIVDRANMIMIRDELTMKKQAKIEYTLMKWTSGQAKIPEAGIRLKKIA